MCGINSGEPCFIGISKKVAGARLRAFIKELVLYFFENEEEKLKEFDIVFWNDKLSAIEYYNGTQRGKGYWALVHSMNLVGVQLEILYELKDLQKDIENKGLTKHSFKA